MSVDVCCLSGIMQEPWRMHDIQLSHLACGLGLFDKFTCSFVSQWYVLQVMASCMDDDFGEGPQVVVPTKPRRRQYRVKAL